MTDLALFTYAEQQIRTGVLDGEPCLVARDLCAVLDLGNVSQALAGLEDDEKGVITTDTPGGPQQVAVVTEAGMYSLVLRSRKPEAKALRRWLTHEVLPAIRKTGAYGTPQLDLDNRDHIALIITAGHAALTRAVEAEAKVAELEPIAAKLLNADGDYSVGEAATVLTRAGVKVGGTRLFTLLSQKYGWLYRSRSDGRWRVMQAAIESGHMSVIPQSHYHPKTGVLVLDPPQPRVTPKGIKRILADHGGSNVAVA